MKKIRIAAEATTVNRLFGIIYSLKIIIGGVTVYTDNTDLFDKFDHEKAVIQWLVKSGYLEESFDNLTLDHTTLAAAVNDNVDFTYYISPTVLGAEV